MASARWRIVLDQPSPAPRPGSRAVRGCCGIRPLRPPAALLHKAAFCKVLASRCAKAALGVAHRYAPSRVSKLDELAIRAVEEGFLLEPNVAKLENMITDALRGKRIIAQYAEGAAESEMEDRMAQAQERAADEVFAQLPDPALEDLDADITSFDVDYAPNINTDSAMRALGFTEQEISDADAITNESQGKKEDRPGVDGDIQAAASETPGTSEQGNAAPRDDAEGLSEPTREQVLAQQDRADESRPSFGLESDSPEAMRQRAEDAREAAAEQRAKAHEARLVENQNRRDLNKAEKDRKAVEIIAERKAVRDAEIAALQNPDAFEFGAEAPAAPAAIDKKVSTEQARGQQDVEVAAKAVAILDASDIEAAGGLPLFTRGEPPPRDPFESKQSAVMASLKEPGTRAVQDDNGNWLLALRERPYTEKEKADAEQRITAINPRLIRAGVLPAVPLSDTPTAGMVWGRSIASTFGYEVTFIQTNPDFHGVAVGGRAFVSPNLQHPEVAVIAHEVLHALSQTDPKAYQSLAEQIRPYLKDGVVEAKRKWEDARGGKNTTVALAEEEVIADLNGSMWLDPKFWNEVARSDPY